MFKYRVIFNHKSFKNYYPPAVFATVLVAGWFKNEGDDIWRIDLAGLKNKWWEDLNFYEHLNPKTRKNDIKYLMTFDPIPPENLTLYHKGFKLS
jgi:hypothetical protein